MARVPCVGRDNLFTFLLFFTCVVADNSKKRRPPFVQGPSGFPGRQPWRKHVQALGSKVHLPVLAAVSQIETAPNVLRIPRQPWTDLALQSGDGGF